LKNTNYEVLNMDEWSALVQPVVYGSFEGDVYQVMISLWLSGIP